MCIRKLVGGGEWEEEEREGEKQKSGEGREWRRGRETKKGRNREIEKK